MSEYPLSRLVKKRLGAMIALFIAVALADAPAAVADPQAENYVSTQAVNILSVLNDPSLSDTARSQKFGEYLHAFAYMPDIARRVLGAHGRALSPADFDRYYAVFEEYATAVYRARFDDMKGDSIVVVGSIDPAPRRSQVNTLIRSTRSGKDVAVIWDVLQSQDRLTYRVRDVGINLDGSVIWLAQDQQAQFEAFLDRNNSDINKLIDRVRQKTIEVTARSKLAASASPPVQEIR
jgi:phospholipid transport system substrate-binding protein